MRVATRCLLLLLAGPVSVHVVALAAGDEPADPPLRAPVFEPLPLGSIRPAGWLERQLRIQASGLSGQLDTFWPDIQDSAWIGGKAEGWERVPYWLDGVVPLAFLLGDEPLKTRTLKYIDSILEHPHEDGWLGPIGDSQKHRPYDPWPLFPLFKALIQYQEATGDPRVIPALVKCARRIGYQMDRERLYSWARFRAADFVVSLYWLYDRTKEPWLLDVAREALDQSHDWVAQGGGEPAAKYRAQVARDFDLASHGVNTGMALKYGGIRWRLSGRGADRNAVHAMIANLDRFHGQVTGIFTCDEHLAGLEPFQGTELCTVVEAMYALELMTSVLGEPALADRLERLAFNALPATFTTNMTAHQYDQQVNQVVCKVSPERPFLTNGPEANLFGLEPNFGCCTANMHQGWPKFATHLWMRSQDGGLAAISYAPCVVETQIASQKVRLQVEGDYPFRDRVAIRVWSTGPARFSLGLRIPNWADAASVALGVAPAEAAQPGTFHVIDRVWQGETTLELRLPMPTRIVSRPRDSVAITRGPLVYALPVAAEWRKLRDREGLPFDDWEVLPQAPWNYALAVDPDRAVDTIRFRDQELGEVPFSPECSPVEATVTGRLAPDWGLSKNAAGPVPTQPVRTEGPPRELTLVPYGCTRLRVTEFPTVGP